jgi:hypothetical protein
VKMMFKLLPPSLRVLGRNTPSTMGLMTNGYVSGVRYVHPMVYPGETDWVLQPQRLWRFYIDLPDFTCV